MVRLVDCRVPAAGGRFAQYSYEQKVKLVKPRSFFADRVLPHPGFWSRSRDAIWINAITGVMVTIAISGAVFTLEQARENERAEHAEVLSNIQFVRDVVISGSPEKPFGGLNLRGAPLEGLDLQAAVFNAADLSNAELEYVNLTGVYLYKTSLEGAHLQGALLTGANLSFTNFSGADLSAADLSDVSQNGFGMSGQGLWNDTNLSYTTFTNDLGTEEDPISADLTGAFWYRMADGSGAPSGLDAATLATLEVRPHPSIP
ncbi:pentapeptide repeat-containing protein [Salinibacterium sp. SWN167]|uniref:pentapeptide repeat-containing protein n=1 Tax=Salinibacterium sp. SWN167 TaxID=2792054 RepID=UPI0018CDAB2B|nr:pentapeptide repeat-containing protein [Salinibacterium sp. SWN167]MBH0084341.1 pentapeptide repeat-containing protein [Salinibacterium sp. SWN167]